MIIIATKIHIKFHNILNTNIQQTLITGLFFISSNLKENIQRIRSQLTSISCFILSWY